MLPRNERIGSSRGNFMTLLLVEMKISKLVSRTEEADDAQTTKARFPKLH